MDINKVTLIGRLTHKPEERVMPSGQKLATFSVATNYIWRDYKTKEKRDKTEFHRVTAWGKLAEVILTYLEKGSRVYLEGRLQYRQREDKDKRKRYSTDIIADEVIMLGHLGKPRNGSEPFLKEEPSDQELVAKDV